MLAGNEPSLAAESVAVGEVGRLAPIGNPLGLGIAQDTIVGDIAEQEVIAVVELDWPLTPLHAREQRLDP